MITKKRLLGATFSGIIAIVVYSALSIISNMGVPVFGVIIAFLLAFGLNILFNKFLDNGNKKRRKNGKKS